MTRRLYDEDAYIREFTAQVLSCEPAKGGYCVKLDRTAFFPESGGQASDRGTLGGAQVTDVQIQDGEILHYTDLPLTLEDTVVGRLDWERRFDFMQNHSGEHVVSGTAYRLFGCENVGFHLGETEITLDLDRELSDEQLTVLEREANAAVFRNAGITARYPDAAELAIMRYRSKREIKGAVRIVEIEGIDRCACCAPHLRATGEIGLMKLLDRERLRGGIRLTLVCGMRALSDYADKYRNIRRISDLLSAKQCESADAVERLQARLQEEKQQSAALRRRFLSTLAETADDSAPAVFEEGLDGKELQELADRLHRRLGGVRAVFSSRKEGGIAFAACGDETELAVLLRDLRAAFPVCGGGRGAMVQGIVDAKVEDLKTYFHF